jgi:flagellar basal body-associated protein FliL
MAADGVTPAKKKPILPIAMALILLLMGGGYFMMKSKDPKPKAAIELAEKDTDVDEFLTNTKTPSVYVRIKMTVRLRKDYEEAKLKENLGDIRDAVIYVLNGLTPEQITDPSRRKQLKRTMAEAMNTALEGPVAESAPTTKTKKHRVGKQEAVAASDSQPENDWDSDTGPILKVRFLALATQ